MAMGLIAAEQLYLPTYHRYLLTSLLLPAAVLRYLATWVGC